MGAPVIKQADTEEVGFHGIKHTANFKIYFEYVTYSLFIFYLDNSVFRNKIDTKNLF